MFQNTEPAIQSLALEWTKTIGNLIFSLPFLGFVVVLFFRKTLLKIFEQFTKGDLKRFKISEFEVERELNKLAEKGHEVVSSLNRTNELMAESRLLELEITESMFGGIFTDEQRSRLKEQIDELRNITKLDTREKESNVKDI